MQVAWTHIIHTCPTVTSPHSRRTPSTHERGEQRCSQKYSPPHNIQRKASKWMRHSYPVKGHSCGQAQPQSPPDEANRSQAQRQLQEQAISNHNL